MINFHDLGVKFASKSHEECIRHAQRLCNFTPNTLLSQLQGNSTPYVGLVSRTYFPMCVQTIGRHEELISNQAILVS